MLAQMATQVVEKKIGDRRGRRVRAGERERERERDSQRREGKGRQWMRRMGGNARSEVKQDESMNR